MPVNETTAKASKPKAKSKKPPVEKEVKSSVSDSKSKTPDGPSSSPGTSCQKVPPSEWFTTEIQAMMHGFGDCRNPLLESARLIEEIVHQQINIILLKAAEIASSRSARFIGPEDLLFLVSKDKLKLARMVKYLEMKDIKTSLTKSSGMEDDEVNDSMDSKPHPSRQKYSKLCHDFLSSIDQTGELLSLFEDDIFDEVKLEREMRRDQLTRCMDQSQYLEYAEARQATFCRKYRTTKFRDWLLKDNLTDIKPSAMSIELFNYMAYETVAEIVDIALLVRQDSKEDVLGRMQAPSICNPEYPSVQTAFLSQRPNSNRPDSPSQASGSSPPQSPGASQQCVSASNNSAAASTAKARPPKKRRKSESHIVQELPSSQCIQPSDIREAVRRYWRQTGPFMLFSKVHRSCLYSRTLSC